MSSSNEEVPNNEDWRCVWNSFYKVLNNLEKTAGELTGKNYIQYPLLKPEHNCIPSEEYLNEWESRFPGTRARLEDAARKEMNHRITLEKIRKGNVSFLVDSLKGLFRE